MLCLPAFGQIVIWDERMPRPIPPHPIPPPRPFPVRADCKIKSVEVNADVQDQTAKVRISQVFQNPSGAPQEAQIFFPMPQGAAISAMVLIVDGKEMTGRVLPKEEARRIYEDIVRRRRDPALLEYIGRDLYQTSVFPVPPNGESTVQIRYTQLLKKDSGLVDFLLPLGATKHSTKPIEKFNVTVKIAAESPIRTVYSPTHQVDITHPDATHAVAKLSLQNVVNSDDLRLLYATEAGPVGVNVISFRPDSKEDGYFVMLASPDARGDGAHKIAKTMVFVCDRSGSMSGKKMEQAKAALQYLVRQLEAGDTFNIIAFDSEVESFRPELQRADEKTKQAALAWVDGLNAGGGTNIDGAMKSALKILNDPSRPNYILFLTDGEPTVGERSEVKIVANAGAENKVHARTFIFGVGFDVNGRLLDRIAREMRGQSVYVRPNENIEAPVSTLYGKVGSPMLTEIAVDIQLDGGATSRVYPRIMPDLFRGDQLVLVGRYKKGGAGKIVLTGSAGGKKQTFTYPGTFVESSNDETNGFVARLWAIRRIGEIIDELDLHGRNQELVDELVGLSTRYGILTPYTSFLADENVNLSSLAVNLLRAESVVSEQLSVTSGVGGFVQRDLKARMQNAPNMAAAPPASGMGNGPGISGRSEERLKQVGQKAFYKKNHAWQDSTVTPEQAKTAIRVVQFSKEYFDLAASNGGKMAQYLALDGPVLVNLAGRTYQIEPEK